MHIPTFKKLQEEGLIPEEALRRIEQVQQQQSFSLYWELRLLLYLGVLLLTGGLGVLVYKHIDTIGHQAVLIFIALVCGGCFYYCIKKKLPFSLNKVEAPNPFFDYILLLGCLSLLIFLGYWQFVYNIFGENYGMATFIPMVILFVAAYYFDHLGVLSLAITNLAAWGGISVTPLTLLKENNFDDHRLIWTGLMIGGFLLVVGKLSVARRLKAHFEATYINFGLHLFFVAALAGLFVYESYYGFWFIGLLAIAYFFYVQARAQKSFYYILVITLYSYIALSYVVVRLLDDVFRHGNDFMSPLIFGLLYFIGSAILIGAQLVRLNRKLKSHDSL